MTSLPAVTIDLFAGIPVRADAPWSLQHPELTTVIWSLAITAVIAPLALRAFNARTTD